MLQPGVGAEGVKEHPDNATPADDELDISYDELDISYDTQPSA